MSIIVEKKNSITYIIDIEYESYCGEDIHDQHISVTGIKGVNRLSYTEFCELKIQNGVTPKTKKPKFVKYYPNDIEEYCLQRLLVSNGAYDATMYEVNIVGGYYGDELGTTNFENYNQLLLDIEQLFKLKSDHEKIMFVLQKEYGYIADIIKNTTTAKIVKVKLSEIVLPTLLGAKHSTEYFINIDYDYYESAMGVLLDGKKLIDGNNRFGYLYTTKGPNKIFKYVSLS